MKVFECPRLMSDRYQKAVYCSAQFATSFPLIEEFLRAKRASGGPCHQGKFGNQMTVHQPPA